MATATQTKYEAVIGLETHCQLNTNTKIFCNCSTNFDSPPNTNICPVCLGHPGVLPVLNQEVLNSAIKMGLALNGQITRYSKFDRKQYFYADLPKNYQISQFDLPIVEHGKLDIEILDKKTKEVTKKTIGVTRLHMEEDAGKLVHAGSDRLAGSTHSLVDFNRTGVPLLEIVSEPNLRSGQEAAEYAQQLRRIVRYLDIGDGNMQEGSLRCDVNISVRPEGQEEFGVKVEIKNMNSFSAIQKAIEYEIERQIEAINNDDEIFQETRLWDESSQKTFSMRQKEGSSDYRYFPEPDLPPLVISDAQLEQMGKTLPELPAQELTRFIEEFGLSASDATVLSDDGDVAIYFETVVAGSVTAKNAANWVTQDIAAYLNSNPDLNINQIALKPEMLSELIALIEKGTISGKIAKEILPELLEKGGSPKAIVESRGLMAITNPDELGAIIDRILEANPDKLELYRGGKKKLQGFFVGQIMKETGGKADPKLANKILNQKLNG